LTEIDQFLIFTTSSTAATAIGLVSTEAFYSHLVRRRIKFKSMEMQ